MLTFYYIVIIILLSIILIQYKARRDRSRNLHYICDKLQCITSDNTNEKLLVVTDDQELISLLIEINRLLDYNKNTFINYQKTKIAMKKMLSNLSHDLKTPLTVVLGYIETINMDGNMQSEERKTLLLKVYNKAKELLDLIQKFFYLSRLESGDHMIPLYRVHINEVCKKNILAFYDISAANGIEVYIDIPEVNIYVLGNDEALDRVLNNLLSNAIKYGSDGKIIGLSLRGDGTYAYIDIWDKGVGINESYRDMVFERMYTLEDSTNKSYPGSGLGLTITKRLMEGMEGDIHLDSKPFEKTVFTMKLKIIA